MTYSSLRALLVKRFNIPKERNVRRAIRSFTLAEKFLFYFFVALFVFAGLALLWKVNSSYLVDVPLRGGTLSEGVVGNPRFINPVLAFSEADRDLTALVYSGLVKANIDGTRTNDLAESVSKSPDGLTYTVRIRGDAFFQDGTQVTAGDVKYTIDKIVNPNIKSPLFSTWSGISVSVVDDRTVNFTLKKPYGPFLDNLTVGILPKAIWNNVSDDEFSFSQFNTLPIGSGPYKISSVTRNSGGIPDYYDLVPYDEAVGGAPFVGHMVFRFYPSVTALLDAYGNGDVTSISGISADQAALIKKDSENIIASPLPRVFGVFFNQTESKPLLDKSVRQALNLTAPKDQIVKDVLRGYGTAIDGPLPAGLFSWTGERTTNLGEEDKFSKAQALLAKAGWTSNPQTGILEKKSKTSTLTLSFSISTGDTAELKSVAGLLQAAWQKLGAKVDVLVFETGDLNQHVIRPRKFDALLFGEVTGRDADVYPFWYSGERNDPGLNIALYANSKVDKLLTEARETSSASVRENDYKSFSSEIQNDVPAVFLYTPSFIYAVPKSVQAIKLGSLSSSEDRFQDIRNWYIETNSVWKLFVK